MATLHVTNFPDDTYDALRRRAATHGRSLAEEVRRILVDAVAAPRKVRDVVRSVEAVRRAYPLPLAGDEIDALLAQDRAR